MTSFMRSLLCAASASMLAAEAYSATAGSYPVGPLMGGPGGRYHESLCPPGMRMVGVQGRRGDWIDGVAPVCAELVVNTARRSPYEPGIRYGAVVTGDYFGGPGGVAHRAECANGQSITGMVAERTWELSEHYVRGLVLDCPAAAPNPGRDWKVDKPYLGASGLADRIMSDLRKLDPRPGVVRPRGPEARSCAGDDVAIGLALQAGDYLDAISIVCASVPAPEPYRCELSLSGNWDCSPPAASPPEPPDITGVGGASPTRHAPSRLPTGGPPASPQRRGPTGINIGRPSEPPVANPPPIAPSRLGPRRYDGPSIRSDAGDMERLDYCLNFGSSCGEPAASAFCAAMDPGRPRTLEAPLEFGIGRSFTIGDRQLCQQENCSGFRYIVCGAP